MTRVRGVIKGGNNMWTYNYANELYHHGIKGMRWGHRRYQNSDGSLTNVGRRRYKDDPSVVKSKQEFKLAKKAYKKAQRKANTMSTYKNIKEEKLAFNKFKSKKFKYQVNKETSRISAKGITFKNKSKHRQNLEDEYRKMGLDKEHAQAAANKRIRAERMLAASATMTVAACAAYYAHHKYKNKIDGIIKAGEKLQRIELQDTENKLHDSFYVAKGKHDSKRYANLLGMTRQKQTGHAYMMKLEAAKDVKVASKDNAAKIFGQLYENDPEFKKAVESKVAGHFNGISNRVKNTNDTSPRNIKKMYENFNSGLVLIREEGSGADKKFYDALKKHGYGAIQDINDMKYSGYHAKNPLIVFDNSNNIMVKTVKEIKDDLTVKGNKELFKATGETLADNFIKKAGPLSAAGLSAGAIYTRRSKPKKYNDDAKK